SGNGAKSSGHAGARNREDYFDKRRSSGLERQLRSCQAGDQKTNGKGGRGEEIGAVQEAGTRAEAGSSQTGSSQGTRNREQMSAKVLNKAAAKEAKIDMIEDGRGTQAMHEVVVA